MVEQAPQYRLSHPDVDPFDENTADHRVAGYWRNSARTDAFPEESVPLFLSDLNEEPDPGVYVTHLRKKRRASISSRILASVIAAAAVAVLFALFSSDAARDNVVHVKASIAAVLPTPSAAAQSDPSQLTQRDRRLNESPQPSAPEKQTLGVRSVTTAAVAPRDQERLSKRAAGQRSAGGSCRRERDPRRRDPPPRS
jgi:hypothetical protein